MVQVIIGLGNPGAQYANNRHNVGAWFVQRLAEQAGVTLRVESKFHAAVAKMKVDGHTVLLAIPTTYMNESGRAVQAIANFYKIPTDDILVAHDEIDFPVGDIKLKAGGGHGGHNGLRSTIQSLGNNNQFKRLRIGVGHPGRKELVTGYVLGDPNRDDTQKILNSLDDADRVLPTVLSGDFEKAMTALHS